MEIVNNNPFRIFGIPVNATQKDISANKSKMRLLAIGKDVTFPLDLPNILSQVVRTEETVADAERKISFPKDKIQYALFWFAKPSDTVGLFGYERLLAGDIDDAVVNFEKSNSWEAKMCLTTISLLNDELDKALTYIKSVLEQHCDEFVKTVVGQTYITDKKSIWSDFISALSSELGAVNIYLKMLKKDVSAQDIEEFRNIAVKELVDNIKAEIDKVDNDKYGNGSARLKAGRDLIDNTKKCLQQLKEIVGVDDDGYSNIADKLAKQINICATSCDDSYPNKTEIIFLYEEANGIAVSDNVKSFIENNKGIVCNSIEGALWHEYHKAYFYYKFHLDKYVDTANRNIRKTQRFLRKEIFFLGKIERIDGKTDFYMYLITKVVEAVLDNMIKTYNAEYDRCVSFKDMKSKKRYLSKSLLPTLKKILDVIYVMDGMDMEQEYKENRFLPNLEAFNRYYKELIVLSNMN